MWIRSRVYITLGGEAVDGPHRGHAPGVSLCVSLLSLGLK